MMTNKRLRQSVRALHLIEAVVLGALIYGPWGPGSWLEVSIQYFFFPMLILSGLILWKQPEFVKFLRGRGVQIGAARQRKSSDMGA